MNENSTKHKPTVRSPVHLFSCLLEKKITHIHTRTQIHSKVYVHDKVHYIALGAKMEHPFAYTAIVATRYHLPFHFSALDAEEQVLTGPYGNANNIREWDCIIKRHEEWRRETGYAAGVYG